MLLIPTLQPNKQKIDSVFLTISVIVFLLHAVVLTMSAFMESSLPILKQIPAKLVVRTINLSEERVHNAVEKKEAVSQPIEPVSQKEIAYVSTSIEKEESDEEEKELTVEPVTKEKEEVEKPIPKESPKAVPKAIKDAPQKKVEAKKSAEKKKSPPKKEVKPSEKTKPKPKAEVKNTQKKEKKELPKPKDKPKQEVKSDSKLDSQKTKQRELIAKAQKNIANIGKGAGKTATSKMAESSSVTIPGAIGSLNIESISTHGDSLFTPQERDYYDELASRLKLLLRLPEFGEVKIKLTLERSGKFVKLAIVNAQSKKNRTYIEQTLPSLKFPSFGDHFGLHSQHTFLINLSNDL